MTDRVTGWKLLGVITSAENQSNLRAINAE